MPNIESVQFNHAGWQPVEKKPYIEVWGDDIKALSAVLSLEYFERPPEISVSLDEINKVRFIYRSLANNAGAALISADVVNVQGVDSIQTIFKMPQANRGFVYIGSLTIPFAQCSYVIKVQCVEQGFTGLRDAVVLDELMGCGGLQTDPATGAIRGWSRDPYDPDHDYPVMPTLADAEEYDEKFPEHALSRVRGTLTDVKKSLQLSDELRSAKRFTPES